MGLTDKVPSELFNALVRSAEQAERGEILPLEPVLARIRARIASAEARISGQKLSRSCDRPNTCSRRPG